MRPPGYLGNLRVSDSQQGGASLGSRQCLHNSTQFSSPILSNHLLPAISLLYHTPEKEEVHLIVSVIIDMFLNLPESATEHYIGGVRLLTLSVESMTRLHQDPVQGKVDAPDVGADVLDDAHGELERDVRLD